jgi:hypothetical protein
MQVSTVLDFPETCAQKYFIDLSKSLTAGTTSGMRTCLREKPYVSENRIHHHDHNDEEQHCDDTARIRNGRHGHDQ